MDVMFLSHRQSDLLSCLNARQKSLGKGSTGMPFLDPLAIDRPISAHFPLSTPWAQGAAVHHSKKGSFSSSGASFMTRVSSAAPSLPRAEVSHGILSQSAPSRLLDMDSTGFAGANISPSTSPIFGMFFSSRPFILVLSMVTFENTIEFSPKMRPARINTFFAGCATVARATRTATISTTHRTMRTNCRILLAVASHAQPCGALRRPPLAHRKMSSPEA
mmetsp:Transcript_1690/g.5317  ORF Transcript_1690/g.5317 Transcript_1690/m.5317 type:complete len:219 (+) Transcript_1690:934-1590(+)